MAAPSTRRVSFSPEVRCRALRNGITYNHRLLVVPGWNYSSFSMAFRFSFLFDLVSESPFDLCLRQKPCPR